MNKLIPVTISLLGLFVTACGGGGGGGGGGAAPPSPIQGVYQGTTSTGSTFDSLVLEDGSWWEIYGVPVGSALGVQGVAVGTSSASNGSFTLSFNNYFQPGTTAISATGSGTYTSTTLVGSFTQGGVTGTFNAVVPPAGTYDYNTPANISSITGSWTGGLLDGESATITVNPNGSFSGLSSGGCSFTGNLTPRASGKNLFNATLTFGAAPCVLSGQTASGVALTYPLGDGTNQLLAGVQTPDKSAVTAFFAQR